MPTKPLSPEKLAAAKKVSRACVLDNVLFHAHYTGKDCVHVADLVAEIERLSLAEQVAISDGIASELVADERISERDALRARLAEVEKEWDKLARAEVENAALRAALERQECRCTFGPNYTLDCHRCKALAAVREAQRVLSRARLCSPGDCLGCERKDRREQEALAALARVFGGDQ